MTEIFNQYPDKEKRQRLRHQSPKAETILWSKIRRRQIKGVKFRRQYGVDRFVLDFYCPALKLAIEVDGPTHLGAEAIVYDHARQRFIEGLGIQFLRFTNHEIYHQLDRVLTAIYNKVCVLSEG